MTRLEEKILAVLSDEKEAAKAARAVRVEDSKDLLSIIKGLCLEESYKNLYKTTKSKANPLGAIKKLLKLSKSHRIPRPIFLYVLPDTTDDSKAWVSDTHMVIRAPKEQMEGLPNGYYYTGYADCLPNVTRVFPKEPMCKGYINKTILKYWKLKWQQEDNKGYKYMDTYVPVWFNGGEFMQVYNREYLEIAMQYLGVNELELYVTNETSPSVINHKHVNMVICPIATWRGWTTKTEQGELAEQRYNIMKAQGGNY